MGDIRFISDLHFGHGNIIKYDKRPFSNVEEHNSALIERWQEVKPNDDVWILGDISWYNVDRTVEIFQQLPGRKHLCVGNHDHSLLKSNRLTSQFVEICDYKELKDQTYGGIILSHYPMPFFNRHFYGWVHLYGHVHNTFEWKLAEQYRKEIETEYGHNCEMINVGCMMPWMDYTPRTIEEIMSGYKEWRKSSDV